MNKRLLKIILPIMLALVAIAAVAGGVSYAKYIEESKVGTVNLAISGVTIKQYVLNHTEARTKLESNKNTVKTVIFDRWTSQLEAVKENDFEWSDGDDSVGIDSDTIRFFLTDDGTTAYFLTRGSAEMMVNDCNDLFLYSNGFVWIEFNNFNTSAVTDMSRMFGGNYGTSNSKALKSIVFGDNFNTANVTNMSCMFAGCEALTQVDVSNFDTSQVTDMSYMFCHCLLLEALDLRNFDTRNVTNMGDMFSQWDPSNEKKAVLSSLTLGENFDTSNVTSMYKMFYGLGRLSDFSFLNRFNTEKVTSMAAMFEGAGATTLDLSSFDTGAVTSMASMFEGMAALQSIVFGDQFTTEAVTGTGMVRMFYDCGSLSSLDLSTFDTTVVTDMEALFSRCSSLKSLNISSFDTSNVTTMSEMFSGCSGLTTLDVTHFNTAKVYYMTEMFAKCSGLTSLNLSSFTTIRVTSYHAMFQNCSNITELDLQTFATKNGKEFGMMFSGCTSLKTIYVTPGDEDAGTGWLTPNLQTEYGEYKDKTASCASMFADCTNLVGGCGTVYNSNIITHVYLRLDTSAKKGYLSHTPHKDTGSDCKCDVCGYGFAPTDANNDTLCDVCGGCLGNHEKTPKPHKGNASTYDSDKNGTCKNYSKCGYDDYTYTCFASGTLITLADGSQKKIEDLLQTDLIRVFDHETGTYAAAPLLYYENSGVQEYRIINLEFSNGTKTRIIYEHALFDMTLNKYVYVTEETFASLVGHEFAADNGKGGFDRVVLNNAYLTVEVSGCYSITSLYHLNHYIDGMISIPGAIEGLFNYFEYDPETLAYDEEKMQADIEEYGLYTYEDFAEYATPEMFETILPAQYLKVAVGKGMITYEGILELFFRYLK